MASESVPECSFLCESGAISPRIGAAPLALCILWDLTGLGEHACDYYRTNMRRRYLFGYLDRLRSGAAGVLRCI